MKKLTLFSIVAAVVLLPQLAEAMHIMKGFLPQMAVLGRDIFGIAAFGERQCTAICLWNIGELEVGIDHCGIGQRGALADASCSGEQGFLISRQNVLFLPQELANEKVVGFQTGQGMGHGRERLFWQCQ